MKRIFIPNTLVVICVFSLLAFFSSCQKDINSQNTDDSEEQAVLVSSEADGEAQLVFNNVFDDAMGVNNEVGIGGTGVFGRINSCPSVSIERLHAPDLFPVKITLDFGTGCVAPDGHFRKGKVITVYTDRLLHPGAMATTHFEDFYFDSIHVEGIHKITNTSPVATPPTTRQFTVDVTDAKLTKPNGNYTMWDSHKTITQFEGLSTDSPLDDVFAIQGHSNGKVQRGNLVVLWESSVPANYPLIKKFTCHWIVKGRIRTVRQNAAANTQWIAILDFGDGSCDNQATISINGHTFQITLR
ncbi:MAG: hypothetical protein R2796_00270 [Chitinophagaceae bacterium]|nr:hypothetical protein [Chitinophagaceae bacterium]HQV06719.1 hypothetical protein [Chitinophagaceae bacterium]